MDVPAPATITTASAAADLRIAYMTGEYPRATDVFIQREVAGLRAAGVHVDTISVRRPSAKERGSDEQEAERRRTRYVLPVSPLALAAAHGSLFLSDPVRYLSTLAFALGRRPGGLRSLAYQCFYFAEAGIVAAHVRAKNFRHLHNHFEGSSCSVAMLASMLGGFTYSMTVHGPTVFFRPENWLLDEKARRALFVSCISHYCRSQVMIHTQEDKWARLHVVHCGVDPESFTPSPVRPGGANLLFVGRLTSVKGIPILLQAIARLRARFPDVRLDIIGDGPERSKLEAQARMLGVADRAMFHGYRSQAQLREQLARTDAFVMSSFAEGVPVVLMEAMAAGVPVVATRIGGIPELVEHGECGLLVPPGDPAALADALAVLLESDELRARFAAAGRAKVEREFNLRHEVARLIEIMTQALRGLVAPVRSDATEGAPARHPAG